MKVLLINNNKQVDIIYKNKKETNLTGFQDFQRFHISEFFMKSVYESVS